VQLGDATRSGVVPPAATDAEVGLTLTDASGDVTMMETGLPITVRPSRVAFAKSVTVPETLPASKVTGSPLEELSCPKVCLLRVHE
jgi:hypothetical protein